MNKMGFSFKRFLVSIVVIGVLTIIASVGVYFYLISSPSKESKTVNIYVSQGETYSSIGSLLKKNNLIKSELAYKIFIKLNKPEGLEYGNYILDESDNLNDIIATLKKGSVNLTETKVITFVEGKNMRYVIDKITSTFSIKEKDILDTLKDTEYLDELINDYWFLTDDIKNNDIYYSLEGYLFPDTYEFYIDVDTKDIFKVMLDNMEKKLKSYKDEINNSEYSIHEMITLASIIELEAGTSKDRKGVAGVFYNRLKDSWSLGSDVTTYYAEKLELWSRDLRQSELDKCNAYNTRNSCMSGKLPVGPVCNPSIDSLVASIEPTNHNYYYFVADKNGKTYFNKNESGHTSTISELKSDGLWYEY